MTSHFTKRFSTIRTMRKFRFALQIHGIRCEFAFFTLLSIDDSRYGDVCVCPFCHNKTHYTYSERVSLVSRSRCLDNNNLIPVSRTHVPNINNKMLLKFYRSSDVRFGIEMQNETPKRSYDP